MTSRSPVKWHPAAPWQLSWKKLWSQTPLEDGEGTQTVGHDTNSLYSEVTPGPCPGVWRRARGRPGFHSLQVGFSDRNPETRAGSGQMDSTAETAGVSTEGQTSPTCPRATTAPQSHSRELRPLPDIPGPPMLYLVRECLPMRTRRSFSVKFLSQGGYRRQWAAVRTQRSLMRLAPQSSS